MLPQYTGVLYSAETASLTCRVECAPLCSITWYKNGFPIEEKDQRYSVEETELPPDRMTGDFESVQSVLVS